MGLGLECRRSMHGKREPSCSARTYLVNNRSLPHPYCTHALAHARTRARAHTHTHTHTALPTHPPQALSFMFEYIGEMGKDYIYAVAPLLEDALMDR